jgi:hypothetical protein
MGKKSKTKGNGFELDIAKQLADHFLPGVSRKDQHNLIHRTPMSGGHVERGDLIIKPPVLEHFRWFIECRNRETWTWKQVWEQGADSVIMTWFREDAHDKCHPYDNLISNKRHPLLVFTKNFRRVYFAAWEHDVRINTGIHWGCEERDLYYALEDVFAPTPVMRVALDTGDRKGYVIISEFDRLLSLHPAGGLQDFCEQLGATYETSNSS